MNIYYLPSNFIIHQESGNEKDGKVEFRSIEIYDDTWGPYISITFSWISYPFDGFHSGDAIQEILNLFAKINMTIEERINDYINSHYFQLVIGERVILKKGTPYRVKEIRGVFYCEQSQREISIVLKINNVQNIFPQWKNTLLHIIKSIKFH